MEDLGWGKKKNMFRKPRRIYLNPSTRAYEKKGLKKKKEDLLIANPLAALAPFPF